jgi:hypothetical protein
MVNKLATPLPSDERKQRQFDILWNSLADNELLPYSAIESLNKQLKTDKKAMIQAINELVSRLSINETTVSNFTSVFNDNVGNPELDTVDFENLRTIDTNVVKAVYKIYISLTDVQADIVNKSPLVHQHEVQDITGLQDSLNQKASSTELQSLISRIQTLEQEVQALKEGGGTTEPQPQQVTYDGGSFTTTSYTKTISGGTF